MKLAIAFVLAIICSALCFETIKLADLSKNTDPHKNSLSGISSGAYFAGQLQVAFSKQWVGAAIIAGGPFFCANGNVEIALTSCMKYPGTIIVSELVEVTKKAAEFGFLDPLNNLFNQKLYLYSGSNDTVVHPHVGKKAEEFYQHFVANDQIIYENTIPSEHAWINSKYGWGNACANLGTPFVNVCPQKNIPFDLMTHILNNKRMNVTTKIRQAVKDEAKYTNYFTFSQKEFVPEPTMQKEFFGIDDFGYIYVPSKCRNSHIKCPVHFNFHGCNQQAEKIGQDYILHNDLNSLAELNDIIMVYPQAHSTMMNPQGCWDWWGYTNPEYASNAGVQPVTIKNMMTALGVFN